MPLSTVRVVFVFVRPSVCLSVCATRTKRLTSNMKQRQLLFVTGQRSRSRAIKCISVATGDKWEQLHPQLHIGGSWDSHRSEDIRCEGVVESYRCCL